MGIVAILAAGMVPWDKVFKPSSHVSGTGRRQTAEGRVRQTERKKAAAAASGGLAEDEGEEGRAIGDVEMTEESEGEEPVREEGEEEADKDERAARTPGSWLLGGAAPPRATWLDRFE